MMDAFEELINRLGLSDEGYRQNYLKVKQMKYNPLMELMIKFNGRPHNSFYEILDRKMKGLELVFTSPKKWGEWYFNDPVKELRILPNGLSSIQVLEGEINPQRWLLEKPSFKKAMVRFIVERSYKGGHFGLLTPEQFFDMVNQGIIPYVIRIVAYTKDKRYKIDVNLVTNEVISDFRWNKIPPRIYNRRGVHEYLIFDKVYSSIPVEHFPRKFLEAIYESDSMDDEILSMIFNVSESMVHNNVGVLMKHGVVEVDEGAGVYRVRLPKQVL